MKHMYDTITQGRTKLFAKVNVFDVTYYARKVNLVSGLMLHMKYARKLIQFLPLML